MNLVSVICTVKNGENTLAMTLESIINQTFRNWELIIVDDGSNDNTDSIIRDFSKRDARIKPIFTDGIGRGKALNKAIKNAKGELLAIVDADDLMHPERLAEQAKYLEKNPHIFLLCTDFLIIYENEDPIWPIADNKQPSITEIKSNILKNNPITHSSVMMRKQYLIELNLYDEQRKSQFDYHLWLRAFIKNKKMIKMSSKLTAKRIHKYQSYENKYRLRYLYRSCKLQAHFIIKYKKKPTYLIIPPLRLLFGLIPFKFRRSILSRSRKMVH